MEQTHTAGRLIKTNVLAHVAALAFGLGGLLIAVPNPHLWADSEFGVRVYNFGVQHAGALHILLAASAMLLTGFRFLGMRRTLIFFAIACSVSLSAELIGTSTGFPFGEYRYTSGLGYKILGDVPFTIPLSWFYMGLASYVLAIVLIGNRHGWKFQFGAVVGGATLLTIWDLVLDPAMAHQQLDVRFWVWGQEGLYFDMPVQNFLGWMLTGTLFIGAGRLIWRSVPLVRQGLVRVAYAIYLANLVFAMAISAGVGLWWPVLITIVVGVLPATMALVIAEGWADGTSRGDSVEEDVVFRMSQGVMTLLARGELARTSRLHVDGIDNIPVDRPAILVSRHYHHLLDGCALQVYMPRRLHILVALDWVQPGLQRRLLESACRAAQWPMVIRPGAERTGQFEPHERARLRRQALSLSVDLMRKGRLLVVFPEGYPVVDPHDRSRRHDADVQSFDRGFESIARAAERATGDRVPLIPVGFDYREHEGWHITLRVGRSIFLDEFENREQVVEELERQVRALSLPAGARASTRVAASPEPT